MDMTGVDVTHLVDVDHGVEQFVYTPACGSDCGHHRYAEHLSEGLVVELHVVVLQLVVHVQIDDHRAVHVDQFGGEVKIALEIRCDNNIDYHVGRLLAQIAHHV